MERRIDLKQLACILCVADSLEFSDTRIVDGVLAQLKDRIKNPDDEEALKSYRENMKHVCIGDSLAIGNDKRIIISGSFNDPEVLNLAHKTIDYIEDWVRKYTDIDFRSPLNRLIVRGDLIERNLTIFESDFERLGIRIKKEHIINLISSNSTWNDSSMAIKELLQNSVEACRYRAYNSSVADKYSPLIQIILDKKEKKIIIKDNGCGMSRNTLLDNFLTVGNSRSTEPTYLIADFKSLARFGIGFWSVFTIAESAHIDSAPFEYLDNQSKNANVDGLEFEVSISEFKDYTLFKKIKRIPGTTIILTIKPEIKLDDLIIRLNSHILCSEIPIEIIDGTDKNFIPLEISLPSLKQLTKAKYDLALEYNLQEYVFEKQYDDLNFKIKIIYRTEDGRATFKINSHSSVLHLMPLNSNTRLAICGFAVNFRLKELVFDLGRVGVAIASVNSPDGFIFNLLRNDLLPSTKQECISQKLSNATHDAYRKFLTDNNVFNLMGIYELNFQSRMNGGNIFGAYTNYRLFSLQNQCPDLVSFKAFKVVPNQSLNNLTPEYYNLNELNSNDLDLWAGNTSIYSKGLRLNVEEQSDLLFKIISLSVKDARTSYYVPASIESDMLFDNDPNSYVQIITVLDFKGLKIPFLRIFSKTVEALNSHPWFIGTVSGAWSGSILSKKIVGAKYIFLGQHKLIVDPNSIVYSEVLKLYHEGNIIKLCNFISLLKEAQDGYIDKSIDAYL